METIRLKVYRYNPDTDAKPYMQDYELEIEPTDVKLLDAIMKLKAKDDSLSFRRSCRLNVIAFIRLGKDGLHTAAVNINHADAVGGIFHNKVVHSASLGVVEWGFMIIRLHYFHLLPLALWLFVIKRLHNWCFSF